MSRPAADPGADRITLDGRGRPGIRGPDGTQVAVLAGYEASFGAVADLRAPIAEGEAWIRLDSTIGLLPGDRVELRNEYQLARANLPAVHECRILECRGDAVRVDDPPIDPILREKQGAFLLKRTDVVLRDFREAGTRGPGRVGLVGGDEYVDVAIEAELNGGTKLEVGVRRRFRAATRVLSERLRFTALPPLAEVYRKNRRIDSGPAFQPAYNVDREGALFWDGESRGVYAYGCRGLSSLTVENPGASRPTLAGLTPFKERPHDPSAAIRGELSSYARALEPPQGGPVVLELRLPRVVELQGLRLLWYRPERRPLGLRALTPDDDGGWEPFLDVGLAHTAGQLDVIEAEAPAVADRVRLELEPNAEYGAVLLRMLDVLVGADIELRGDPPERAVERVVEVLQARGVLPRAV